MASLLEHDFLQLLALIKCALLNFSDTFRNSRSLYLSITKTSRPDLLQPASFQECYALQIFAPKESIDPNFFYARRNFHILNLTAVEPAISNLFNAIRNDRVLAVLKAYELCVACCRLSLQIYCRGIRYSCLVKTCFALGIQINAFKVSTTAKYRFAYLL